ncbi:hypothetical protein ATANTOWER_029950 [Ataeniobius toweri]|uniref:Uncharacterized protein n=1 Tax=Ataeniobius toweri TaxID=208326 RepID=A0ABU7BVB5_9TELE|nr:hypothetical protein [Ataeniobius toweri]
MYKLNYSVKADIPRHNYPPQVTGQINESIRHRSSKGTIVMLVDLQKLTAQVGEPADRLRCALHTGGDVGSACQTQFRGDSKLCSQYAKYALLQETPLTKHPCNETWRWQLQWND